MARARLSVLAALLAATFFRTLPLSDNRFHPDEALYASFALRITSGHDPLLSGVVVDKPPLPFYLTAASLLLVGRNELAARLPNLLASLVSLPLVWALGRRFYPPATASLAVWVFALSPFAILFAITVFTDPLLTALGLWGLWMAAHGRARPAGLALGLAFAVKQTALVFLPLYLAVDLLNLAPEAGWRVALDRGRRSLVPLLGGLAVSALAVFAWDFARHAPIGFWEQGYSDNWPGRLIRANELLPRAQAWIDLLHYVTAATALNFVFLVGLPVLLLQSATQPSRAALADFALAGFALLHLAAYWLLAFAVFDRYLVPFLPILALLLARVVYLAASACSQALFRFSRQLGTWGPGIGFWLPVAVCLLLLPPALSAARSGYPIGGDHGAYEGIDDAARFVHTLPYGTVLYDHWLSWEWNFYLFDSPAYVSWFAAPENLAQDLRSFGRTSPRFLAVPAWEADAEVRSAAASAGFAFIPVHTSYRRDGSVSIRLYELRPSSR